jgi:hypothetical protein
MKAVVKCENDEFLVISLKHVRVLMRHANTPRTQKIWAKLMKMTIKQENDEFLVMTLKHVLGIKVVVNLPGTPKLWAIDHENSRITRKR